MNLVSALKDTLTPAVISRIAEQTKESPDKVQSALANLHSVFLAGFMKRSSNETGAQLLYKLIEKGGFDGGILDQPDSLLKTTDQFTKLVTQGSSMVSQLLPDKKSPIAGLIAQHNKVRNSSAFNLQGIAATLVMHVLGKAVSSKKLDAAGLALLLTEQKESLVEATPPAFFERMVDMLGISNLMNIGYVQVVDEEQARPNPIQKSEKPFLQPPDLSNNNPIKIPMKWIVVGVIGILVVLASIYIWRNWSSDSGQIPDTTAQVTPIEIKPDSATTQQPDTTATASPTVGSTLPNGEKLTVPTGSFQEAMAQYLADTAAITGKKFVFDKLTFVPNSLTLTPEAETEVGELAKVMKAFPNAQIKLTGYVGATADSLKSKSMSFKRANAVKLSLMGKGIDVMRLDAVGGGRSSNRIDIKVVRR